MSTTTENKDGAKQSTGVTARLAELELKLVEARGELEGVRTTLAAHRKQNHGREESKELKDGSFERTHIYYPQDITNRDAVIQRHQELYDRQEELKGSINILTSQIDRLKEIDPATQAKKQAQEAEAKQAAEAAKAKEHEKAQDEMRGMSAPDFESAYKLHEMQLNGGKSKLSSAQNHLKYCQERAQSVPTSMSFKKKVGKAEKEVEEAKKAVEPLQERMSDFDKVKVERERAQKAAQEARERAEIQARDKFMQQQKADQRIDTNSLRIDMTLVNGQSRSAHSVAYNAADVHIAKHEDALGHVNNIAKEAAAKMRSYIPDPNTPEGKRYAAAEFQYTAHYEWAKQAGASDRQAWQAATMQFYSTLGVKDPEREVPGFKAYVASTGAFFEVRDAAVQAGKTPQEAVHMAQMHQKAVMVGNGDTTLASMATKGLSEISQARHQRSQMNQVAASRNGYAPVIDLDARRAAKQATGMAA